MTLETAETNRDYKVLSITNLDEQMKTRLFQFGINPGAIIKIKRKAPLFRDPLLLQVGQAQIVISKDHARNIEVEAI